MNDCLPLDRSPQKLHYPQSSAGLSNPSESYLTVNRQDIILYIYIYIEREGISRLDKPCLFLLKKKVITCPLECLMSILLTCRKPSFNKWVIVIWIQYVYASMCQRQNLSAELYDRRGKKDHVWSLQHNSWAFSFCTISLILYVAKNWLRWRWKQS